MKLFTIIARFRIVRNRQCFVNHFSASKLIKNLLILLRERTTKKVSLNTHQHSILSTLDLGQKIA